MNKFLDERGLISPVDINHPMDRDNRSPYKLDITQFVDRFGKTVERLDLLDLFLDYRKTLHESGIFIYKQWVDGSFCEDCEKLRNRHPRDIDVVSFYSIFDENLFSQGSEKIEPDTAKKLFNVDSYFILIPTPSNNNDDYINNQLLLISNTSYWYSAWSHTRNGEWKGFIELDKFSTDNYNKAKRLITNKRSEING